MSSISAGTTTTTGYVVTSDTTGSLVLKTGASDTTAVTINGSQNVTFAGSQTLSGGTANGVTYLNGSKVLTSGSALTFDGTNMAVGTTPTSFGAGYSVLTVQGSTTGFVQASNGTIVTEVGTYSGIGYTGTRSNHSYGFVVNGSEQMRLTSTGLGIGTSSPSEKLHVAGRSRIQSLYLGEIASNYDIVQATSSAGLRLVSSGGSAYLDSSGNLGLGVTPSAWSATWKAFQTTGGSVVGSTSNIRMAQNWYHDGTSRYVATRPASMFVADDGTFAWYTAASGTAGNAISFTQAMTLDASSNLLVGTTTARNRLTVVSGAGSNPPALGTNGGVTFIGGDGVLYGLLTGVSTSGYAWMQAQRVDGTASAYDIVMQSAGGNLLVGATSFADGSNVFRIGGSTISSGSSVTTTRTRLEFNSLGLGTVGSISTNGSATTYSTSSDYRLKNTIAPMTGALAKVALLKPCTYKWNADGSNGEGFIAHELAEVCPDAVVGIKDAVDENGNPIHQGIDTSFLVATVVAALQEQQALIQSLKARLDAANL